MDVTTASTPPEYDAYRERLRAFIARNVPVLSSKQRTGLRVPEDPEDVSRLRSWTRSLFDAGYVLDRFSMRRGDPHEQRILQQELAASGVPFVLGNPLVSGALKTVGTAEQRDRYLVAMARGEHIWTQLFSEPGAGSDLAALSTRATKDGDHYVVDGQKVWSTWAQWADFGYLLARTEPVAGPGGITAMILDMRSPGVDVRPLREMTGTSDFNEVFFDSVQVPVENVIGEPGKGWAVARASLAQERSGVGTDGSGSALKGLFDAASKHSRNGRPAITDPGVRNRLGDLVARSRILRHLGQKTATRASRGQLTAWDAPLTKIWFSELNLELSQAVLELQGARSMLVEADELAYDSGRWQDMFLYARAWTIAGGSNEILRNVIAERGLGLPREERGST
jgi:alkylation response protein AidB-like acyl-CoA dehydrogenase